ncbi:MAG: PAS domain S-box protein, partial [Gemmatimonadota bacterium]|nr:PAS domain S-box protein [Gemmatimonadota bacterium]
AFELAYRIRRKDGAVRHVWERGRRVAPAADGPAALEGFIMDVTERTEAAAARDRLLVAIEQLDESVVVTDPDGTIEYVNAAFERVTGYSREDALGRNPSILRSGEHDAAFYADLWGTIASGRTWTGRIRNRRKNGTLYTEDTTISPVFDAEGRIVRYIAVKADVTERLELEEQFRQSQRMESVGRLAGGLAHDLNNMLTVILGHAQLELEEKDPGSSSAVALREITDAAERSSELIRQLLAFARRQPAHPRRVDLNERIEGMTRMLRRLIGEGVELTWRPGEAPGDVLIDPVQVDQIVANLCVNARDAIAGAGRITVETAAVEFDEEYCRHHPEFRPGEYVMLAVSDDGAGMDEETRLRVFEPYFTTKAAGQGTGLGLSTVYGIVRQNGGFVHVYSEPGSGSTFRIYFARHRGADPHRPEPVTEGVPEGRGETILLVEDEPRIGSLCSEMLGRLGYEVLSAATPAEALDFVRAHEGRIHLLLTDVILPGMNGRELHAAVEEIRPDVACLYMSGYTANVIVHHGVVDPDTRFLPKPFHLAELARAVRGALDG